MLLPAWILDIQAIQTLCRTALCSRKVRGLHDPVRAVGGCGCVSAGEEFSVDDVRQEYQRKIRPDQPAERSP